MNPYAKPIDRFMARVAPEAITGCWIWTGSVQSFGYGLMMIKGKSYSTHRLSWTFFHGSIPDGVCVLHQCDNPSCVNPSHLFLGVQRDNMIDMAAKQRARNANTGITVCKNGHPLTGDNVYEYSYQRVCKTCSFARTAQYRQQRKENGK